MLVTIGTPHSGHFAPQYLNSMDTTLLQPPCQFQVLKYEGCYVHALRNLLFNDAIGDYILFIDSDMKWQPEDISRLIKTGKDIVGGLYYKRRHPYGPVVYRHDGGTFVPMTAVQDRLFQCDGIGTGFLLISRKIIDRFKEPELLSDWGFAFDPIKSINPGQSGSYYMGEDLSFCLKARHLGMEIWCDPETLVTHIGCQEVKGPL